MKSKVLLLILILTTVNSVISIQLGPDGGYTGIVIKISEDVPEDLCDDIRQKIQVRKYYLFSGASAKRKLY